MESNRLLYHQQELLVVVLDIENVDVYFISETIRQSYSIVKGCKVYHTIHPENIAKGGRQC